MTGGGGIRSLARPATWEMATASVFQGVLPQCVQHGQVLPGALKCNSWMYDCLTLVLIKGNK